MSTCLTIRTLNSSEALIFSFANILRQTKLLDVSEEPTAGLYSLIRCHNPEDQNLIFSTMQTSNLIKYSD